MDDLHQLFLSFKQLISFQWLLGNITGCKINRETSTHSCWDVPGHHVALKTSKNTGLGLAAISLGTKCMDFTVLGSWSITVKSLYFFSDVRRRLDVCPDRQYAERNFCFYEFEWPCGGRCIPKSEVCDETDLGGCDAGMKRCGKDRCVDRNTPCNGKCWSETAQNICGKNMCLSKYQLEVKIPNGIQSLKSQLSQFKNQIIILHNLQNKNLAFLAFLFYQNLRL